MDRDEDGEVEIAKPIDVGQEILSEYEYLPCRFICTQDELLRLAGMGIARTITVKDPLGYCRSLLDKAVDASDVTSLVSLLKQVLDSCKHDPQCRKVIILDIRGLPRRPRNPWRKIISIIHDIVSLTKITVILYTDDPAGRPRWANIDDIYILCK